jgi:hypothetical protein
MLLNDSRLAFAQHLIGHWTTIRGNDLVPLKQHIDPGELRRVLPYITMLDATHPEAPAVRLAGTGIRARYGREITGTDWSNYIPAENRPRLRAIISLLLRQPCGIMFRYKISADGDIMREAETVSLPLRTEAAGAAKVIISVTRDIDARGIADSATIETARLENTWVEFIDIGAGLPDAAAIRAALDARG